MKRAVGDELDQQHAIGGSDAPNGVTLLDCILRNGGHLATLARG